MVSKHIETAIIIIRCMNPRHVAEMPCPAAETGVVMKSTTDVADKPIRK